MIKIYTKNHCPYCQKAKITLENAGLQYEEHILMSAEEFNELKARSGHMTVPQIFVGEVFIGGSDDLERRLDEVIKMSQN